MYRAASLAALEVGSAGRGALVWRGVRVAAASVFFSGFFLNGFLIVMLASFPLRNSMSPFLRKSRGSRDSLAIFGVHPLP